MGLGGPKLILVKPLTYMNLSGAAVDVSGAVFQVPFRT
jgi:PTH1 family peptidyl-tRNA hydrolase